MTIDDIEPWGGLRRLGQPTPRWSDADVAELQRMVHDGATDEQIAGVLGRTPRSVAIKRTRLGLTIRNIAGRQHSVRGFATGTLANELRRRGFSVVPRRRRTVHT